MVSILSFMGGELRLPSDFVQRNLPAPLKWFDVYPQPSFEYSQQSFGRPQPSFGYPQPSYWYRSSVQSERELLSSRVANKTNRTHVEDVKDPDELLLPSNNLVLVTLRKDEPEDCTPFALLIDPPLHPGHGATIGSHR